MRHRTAILTGIFSHYSDVTVGSIVLFVMIACCPVLLRGKACPDAVPNYRIGPWSLPRVRRTLRTSPTNYYLIGRLTQILPPIDRPCTINKHVRSLSLPPCGLRQECTPGCAQCHHSGQSQGRWLGWNCYSRHCQRNPQE